MCGINDQQTQKKLLAEKALSFDRAMEMLSLPPREQEILLQERVITSPFMLLQTRHPQFMLFQTRHPQWQIMLTLLHPPTLDSFYLDTIHDTEDSTFWMTDVRVNNISVPFKVDISRYRGNGSLRKYPTDFGSARGQHAGQETVWTKWCSARLEGKAHSNFISEVAQM